MNSLEIDYYVITSKNDIRLKNIEEQEKKINNNKYNINIQKIDSVMGTNLDLNKLVFDKILSDRFLSYDKRKRGQIGCYMSHLKIYDIIKQKNKMNDYSIIFEDDFIVVTDDFINIVNKSLNSLENINEDFDMIFIENNAIHVMPEVKPNYGEHIIDNIYHIDPGNYFYGTAGIIIKNKNIDRIINLLNYIEEPIDQKIQNIAINKTLNIFIMNPLIIEQHHNMDSLINI
jgi:GR25 family glycosyltransferase involved in LPS biosynthesis